MSLRRFPWGLTLTVLIALGILISLGVWQLQRLEWKEGLLARRAALEHAPARPLDEVLTASAGPEDLDMARVSLTCPGLAKAPFLRLYSLAGGKVVTRLVSPCPLANAPYGAILVDRGRIAEEISALPAVDPADASPIDLTGVLRRPDRGNPLTRLITPKPPANVAPRDRLWMGYDIPAMASALGAFNPAPVFVAAETSSNPEWQALTPGLPSEDIPNNHLQYAFTWFGLAGVLLSIYAAMLRKRLKRA